jgi:hypothetical protein
MVYRAVPWKRNVNKVPKLAQRSLDRITSDLVVCAVTRSLTANDTRTIYPHLNFPDAVGQGEISVPPVDMGKYSERNIVGWTNVRRDLPMITKTYIWETPNFGDEATYGTHTHYQDREVYQREVHEPRGYAINVELLRAGRDGGGVYKFSIDHLLDRHIPTFELELLFMLNLLQENVGGCDVFASDAPRAQYLGTIHLNWDLFPPGNLAQVAAAMTRGRRFTPDQEATLRERLAVFDRLRPRAYLRGTGGMSTYIGAQYADDLVVFENVSYGNALYILYDNWEDVSQRSRTDLLRGTDARFDRIIHKEGWQDGFSHIMDREKRRRRIR